MFNPPLALLISIVIILVLLIRKLHPGFAILAGGIILSLLVIPIKTIPSLALNSLIDKQTLTLLVVVASAMTMSSLMELKQLLARLANTIEGIGPKLAMHLVPAVIGLVPMPAGALVSATALKGLTGRLGLKPEHSTFINYWFRHIWEFSIPVYPTVIVTAAILSAQIFDVVKILAPMTVLVVVLGSLVSYRLLKNSPKLKAEGKSSAKSIVVNLLKAAWPILLLVFLIFVKVDAMIAFPATLVLLAAQQRANGPELKKALKYGLNPKVILLLYAIMLYKAIIQTSGAAQILVSDMQTIGFPAVIILAGLPALMGLATGYGPAFSGLALPLLVPYIVTGTGINGSALLLAFVSGMMGQLLSPMHLCFILSAEYFKASLGRVYRYTIPLTLGIEAIVIVVYFFTNR